MSDLQRTDEWYKARLGRPTASSYSKLIGAQGKPSTQAQGYINQLIAEAMTGERQESHTTPAMQRGIELEGNAIAFYELERDVEVVESGFVVHKDLNTGCSPDGLVGNEGLLEIKCPSPHTHVKYLRAGKLPSEYKPQVMGQMWVMERDWCDFLSYHPDMPCLLIRVERDEEYINLLAEQVRIACETIEKEVKTLKEQMQ